MFFYGCAHQCAVLSIRRRFAARIRALSARLNLSHSTSARGRPAAMGAKTKSSVSVSMHWACHGSAAGELQEVGENKHYAVHKMSAPPNL